MGIVLIIILATFIIYSLICIVLGDNYVWQIIRAIGQYLFPGNMPESNYAYSFQNKVSVRQLIKKLEKIGYFRPYTAAEKEAFLKCLKATVYTEKVFLSRMHNTLFEYDKRSFIVVYFDRLIIDVVGNIHKWEGLRVRENDIDLKPFFNYLLNLGLDIKFGVKEKTDSSDETYEVFDLYINGKQHRFFPEYITETEDFCTQLVQILNQALEDIDAEEHLHIWDSDPAILIFLTKEQNTYLRSLNTHKLK